MDNSGATTETSLIKPRSITVIGWLFIILSLWLIFTNFFSALGYLKVGLMPIYKFQEKSIHVVAAPAFIFWSSILIKISEIIFAIFISYTASQFLKLRHWARASIEIITIVLIFRSIVYWIYDLYKMYYLGGGIINNLGRPPVMFWFVGFAMLTLKLLLILIPALIVLKALKKEELKAFFKPTS